MCHIAPLVNWDLAAPSDLYDSLTIAWWGIHYFVLLVCTMVCYSRGGTTLPDVGWQPDALVAVPVRCGTVSISAQV